MKYLFDDTCLFNSHMAHILDDSTLLYCVSPHKIRYLEHQGMRLFSNLKTETTYRAYSINACNIDLETGETWNHRQIIENKQDNIFCNPHGFINDAGETVLTFVFENVNTAGAHKYALMQTKGKDLDSLGQVERLPDCMGLMPYSAFNSKNYRVVVNSKLGNTFIAVYDKREQKEMKIQFGGLNFIRRASYISGEDNKFILTATGRAGLNKGYVFDINTNEIREIDNSEASIYKCTAYKGNIIASCKDETESGYSCRLKYGSYTLKDVKIWPRQIYEIKRRFNG